ncbi:MAG TPA: tripartite tricarboxylate transporter substrate binding protein [Burkholderiales bacterium]|nr:tripartite tricarboxylate transporter substrate binding protein [Burkholderiales bacterium]
MRRKLLAILVLLFPLLFPAGAAHGQAYPTRSIRLVVPQSAGGPSDVLGRLVAQRLGDGLGQSMVVENKPGAGGQLGAEAVAKSPPDGYNLIVTIVGTMAIDQSLYPKLRYQMLTDLAPVGLLAASSLTLVAHPSLPVKSIRELIEYAKTGKPVNVGSAGNGTVMHLSLELLNKDAGIKLNHVPYKGAAPAMNDLLGGFVQMAFVGTPAAVPMVQQGRLRGIATTGVKRSSQLPDVPTMLEAGLQGFDVENVYGLWAPGGTPKAVIDVLAAETRKLVAAPDFGKKMESLGFEARGSTPDELDKYERAEIAKWGPLIKSIGLVME